MSAAWYCSCRSRFAAVGLTVLYLALPHRRVDWRHAHCSAASSRRHRCSKASRCCFGVYINRVGTFESVYGSLSALPVFLIWMYLVWAVVLIGAAVAAARPEWLANRSAAAHDGPLTPARCMLRALQVIEMLATDGPRRRAAPTTRELLAAAAGDGEALGLVMANLQNAGYIVRTDDDKAVLVCPLSETTLFELYEALGYAIGRIDPGTVPSMCAWGNRIAELLAQRRGRACKARCQ